MAAVNAGFDPYRLERDTASSLRLNAQHFFWHHTLGFTLHPGIDLTGRTDVKVADIGCGTSIWTAQLKLLHDVPVDGFDKNLAQCPPRGLWSKNCAIYELDVTEEVPAQFRHAYDVVHVRLLQGALRDDPVPALRHMMSMLKPGGWLQWEEVNLATTSVSVADPALKRDLMDNVLKEIQSWNLGRWVPRLASFCADQGMVNAKTHHYRVPEDIAIAFTQTQMGAYNEISKADMDSSTPESQGPLFRKLLHDAHAELSTGVWLDHTLECTTAQMPQ